MELMKFSVKKENLKLADFYSDDEDIIQDYQYIKNLINLRDFQCIFSHQLIIEKEMTFFLAGDFPRIMPFYNKISLFDIESFKDKINNCEKFEYEKLNLSEKTIKDLDSIILNNSFSPSNQNNSNLSKSHVGGKKSKNLKNSKNNRLNNNKQEKNNENSENIIVFNFSTDTHKKQKSNNQNNISNIEKIKDSNNAEIIKKS